MHSSQTASSEKSTASNEATRTWHHKGPVIFSPLFDWPPRPVAALLAITKRWVTITRNALFLIFAVGLYQFLIPDLSNMQQLSADWIVPLLLRNLALMLIVAGGLHVYLFKLRGQGKKTKFDSRTEMSSGKKYLFKDQVYDNVFWSLTSGVGIWSVYEILYFWGAANGLVSTFTFASQPVAFFIWLLAIPLILSSHFYLIHRLLHWPPLFKRYHRLHHLNIHIGPWSGMSMHPVEHIIYISSVLIHFVIASHPVIFLVHLYARCLGPAFSHSGFEKLFINNKELAESADFHHQLHHKYFECNYGTVDMPLDRWFGTVHDGSDEATNRIQLRRKNMYRKYSKG